MLRASFLAMTILLLPSVSDSAGAAADPDGNAALKYWQAFATLPTFTEAENKKLAESLTTPLDDLARKILADADYSLRMMHYGVAQPRCDWGVSHEEGIFTRLPQANAARVLSSLACLRARMRSEAGQGAEAVDDIVAGMILGRHSSLTGTNLMLLSGYAVEHRMIETLALLLPKLDPRMIPDLKKRLAAIPKGMTTAESLATEEQYFLDWFIRTVKKAKDKESLLSVLAFINNEPEGGPRGSGDKARAFVEECGGASRACFDVRRRRASLTGRWRRCWPCPWISSRRNSSARRRRGPATRCSTTSFPPSSSVRRAQARMDVRRALLSAALAIRQDGPEALKNDPAPVVGGPFEYVPFDGGFELRSTLKGRDDKPVTLTVGHRS